ncbi:hypothetical protein CEXT_776721 [Caerostris extrusa]|uniref:Uncharacterized protein n=1 Tax=Caerostris extrusa TaxID=172846 RepID=A0AAV4WFL1_CAEEX|nr:hypothetical protein CEXT_776721 [Caerostris extrusa]
MHHFTIFTFPTLSQSEKSPSPSVPGVSQDILLDKPEPNNRVYECLLAKANSRIMAFPRNQTHPRNRVNFTPPYHSF